MPRPTHITVHRYYFNTEPDPWTVKVSTIEEVTIVPPLWRQTGNTPNGTNSILWRRGDNSPNKVTETVEEIQAMIDGKDDR